MSITKKNISFLSLNPKSQKPKGGKALKRRIKVNLAMVSHYLNNHNMKTSFQNEKEVT